MGRKKKSKPSIPEEAPPAQATIVPVMDDSAPPPTLFAPPPSSMPPPPPSMSPPITDPRSAVKEESSSIQIKSATIRKVPDVELDEADMGTKPSSMYGLHSHSGDLVEDDIYVSDGSLESEDDEEEETKEGDGGDTATDGEKKTKENKPKQLELVLTTSKMGLMRRGGISTLFGQPVNRTWVRSEQTEGETKDKGGEGIKQEEEEEITDPAQLLVIQQRKIEQAKQNARILESSENAGRDPCLFSKRTAFDIRMDQIEDKPWDKGGSDLTDYMNYGLTEEDWVEYAERQLAVRQELTDAAKQKRLPDPGIVPVVPRVPTKQGDRVAVRVKTNDENEEETDAVNMTVDSDDEDVEMVVETAPKSISADDEKNPEESTAAEDTNGSKTETSSSPSKFDKVVGGAWGAGAKEDSMLIKLIQEQSGPPPMIMGAPMMGMPPPNMMPPPIMGMQPNMQVPPPPPPQMMQQQQHNQSQGHDNRRDMHHERNSDGPWRRDMHSQQGPPPHQNRPNDRERERYDGGRGGGHPGPHWDQQHASAQNFRQQPPPFQRRGPPPHAGPPGGFQQWGRGPPMGRGGGRGDFGGRGGPPSQWGEGRKRPRDFDPRGRGGRW